MEDLKHLAREATAEKVKVKVLELIQCWAHVFKNKDGLKIITDTYDLMKLEGAFIWIRRLCWRQTRLR